MTLTLALTLALTFATVRYPHYNSISIVNCGQGGENNDFRQRICSFFPSRQMLFCESETTKLYLKVTEPELVGAMFDKALERYTTSDVDQFTKGQ